MRGIPKAEQSPPASEENSFESSPRDSVVAAQSGPLLKQPGAKVIAMPRNVRLPNVTANNHGALSFPVKLSRQRAYKVHSCSLVQHGHSLGETSLYKALWDAGEGQSDGSKVITIGWKVMGRIANLSDKAAKRNTAGLIAKLAIEQIADEDPNTRTGRKYRIYPFAQILERRKRAGLVWAIWDRGRRFVREDGSPFEQSPGLSPNDPASRWSLDKASTVDKTSTVAMDKMTPVPMDVLSPGTGDVLSTPLRSLLRKQLEIKTSSSERRLIVQALAQYGTPDDQAADELWRRCLEICSDATVDELVILIHEKGLQVSKNRSVKNPIGFLLTAVPKCFRPESIAELRRQQAQALLLEAERKEDEKRRELDYVAMLKSDHEKYLAISLDPSASQEKRKRADAMLAHILPALENALKHVAESLNAVEIAPCV